MERGSHYESQTVHFIVHTDEGKFETLCGVKINNRSGWYWSSLEADCFICLVREAARAAIQSAY